jgi:hypothetical protein
VLQIVFINEIMGNPVSQYEIPRGLASARVYSRNIETLGTAHTRMSRPRRNRLVRHHYRLTSPN